MDTTSLPGTSTTLDGIIKVVGPKIMDAHTGTSTTLDGIIRTVGPKIMDAHHYQVPVPLWTGF